MPKTSNNIRAANSIAGIARLLRLKIVGQWMRVMFLLAAIGVAGLPALAEPIGTQSQPLVSPNPPVSVFDRERLGLVNVYSELNHTTCSGALLTNLWVITAAHCVENLNGGQVFSPGIISVTGKWRTSQVHKNVQLINFRPVDIALIRLDHPMRVFGSERRFQAQLWRPGDGDLSGHGIRVFGMGLSKFATSAGQPAEADDNAYRWFDTTIKNVGSASYSYPASANQSVLGGDSGGPSFFDQKITGVHSLDTVHCLNNAAQCSWDKVDKTYETWDARVSLVVGQIDAAISQTAPPEWADMTVAQAGSATRFGNPTVHIENDDYRADVCQTWAKDCGESAAEAFCRTHELRFTGKVAFDAAPFGHTGMSETGETCFGAGCQAFTNITCFTGTQISELQDKPGGFRVEPDTHPATEAKGTGGFADVVGRRSDLAGYVAAVVMQKSSSSPGSPHFERYVDAANTIAHSPTIARAIGAAPSMTGTFDTDFGVLTLAANDGAYTASNGRVKILRIYGDSMDGAWTQSTSGQRCEDGTYRGSFHFQFTNDGFDGTYGYCDGPPNAGRWNGKRQ